MRKLSVLIVDDNPLYAGAAARFLIECCQLDVVGVAASGEEGIACAAELKPDLVLMDEAMGGNSGLEASLNILLLPRPPRVVIVTLDASPLIQDRARMFGCDAVIAKNDFTREIPRLIDVLYGGAMQPAWDLSR